MELYKYIPNVVTRHMDAIGLSSLRSGCLKERPIPILAASSRALPGRGSIGARIRGRLGVFSPEFPGA